MLIGGFKFNIILLVLFFLLKFNLCKNISIGPIGFKTINGKRDMLVLKSK